MPTQLRMRSLIALAVLALVQAGHLLDVLRYADDAGFPAVLADPLAITGIGAATLALITVATRQRIGPLAAIAAGGGVAIGFLLYHGLPIDIGINNPYWGPDSEGADAIQWITVLGAITAGLWAAWLGRELLEEDRPALRR